MYTFSDRTVHLPSYDDLADEKASYRINEINLRFELLHPSDNRGKTLYKKQEVIGKEYVMIKSI